jgi:uncharacterized cupredoxin-like copper-binding protein
MSKKHILQSLAFAMAVASTSAMAHSDSHAPKPAFDPAKVEETPFGRAGDPKKATRTIKVGMSDSMRFTPASLDVKAGETVKFVVANGGKVLHEMVLGTTEDLKKHAELMRKFPEMEHEAANMAHVKPGNAGEIVWQFTKPGEFSFACLIPGHFEAGMVGKVTVK